MSLARRYTERALRLIRYGNGESAHVRRGLAKLAKEIERELTRADIGRMSRRSLQRVLRDVQAAIAGHYKAVAKRQAEQLATLVEVEAAWAVQASGFDSAPSGGALAQTAAGLAVFGEPVAEAWARQGEQLARRTTGLVLQVSAGAMAASALDLFSGLSNAAQRNADALVHTSVTQAAQDTREAVWRENGVNAFRFHAVLDSRTTPGCAVRHGLVYDLDTLAPLGHDIVLDRTPPRHYRCRSILLPMAYGPDIPRPKDGGESTFRAYFDGLSEAEQERLFGVGRAELFRRGVITQSDLIGQQGQVLTLGELRASGRVSAYDEAHSGGRYAKFFKEHERYSDAQLIRSSRSLRRTISDHEKWISNPRLKIGDGASEFEIENLVRKKWPKDIERNKAYLDIVLGILRNRGK